MPAYIIVDLGFGDAGKGLLTDFLCRHLDTNLVVRYNGGAQAGHNVLTPSGKQHTFSQFGAGSFLPHLRTYLSKDVVIHPTALLYEGKNLAQKGVPNPFSRLRISENALVITPFHQAANHLRELARGEERHGSCGVGVGETVADSLAHPKSSLRAADLQNPSLLRRKLRAIRESKYAQLHELCQKHHQNSEMAQECDLLRDDELIEQWIAAIAEFNALGMVVPDATLVRWFGETENVIFEGAQGVLLDEDAGFHPYTTWSHSTTVNATRLVRQIAPQMRTIKIGVLRSYAVRHGPGPLPTENKSLAPLIAENNRQNAWQGTVRYGDFDAVLARYALRATGGVDMLALTHLDILPKLKSWRYCSGYVNFPRSKTIPLEATFNENLLTDFYLSPQLSLSKRAAFTRLLTHANPHITQCAADEEQVIRQVETLLGEEIGIISRGARAKDVELRKPLF